MFTTKLLLLVFSCAAGVFVGLFFSNALKRKRDFFAELQTFISRLIDDITFRQDGISAIISEYSKTCKSRLKSVLEQYSDAPTKIPSLSFLLQNERQPVSDLFMRLGKSDIITEKSELEHARFKIGEIQNRYTDKCDKRCSMMIKLGLLGGLAIGILLL